MGKLDKQHILKLLEPISDADPHLMLDYVMVLLNNDKPRGQLRAFCVDQLQDFLGEETESFVTALFASMGESDEGPAEQPPAPNVPEDAEDFEEGEEEEEEKPKSSSPPARPPATEDSRDHDQTVAVEEDENDSFQEGEFRHSDEEEDDDDEDRNHKHRRKSYRPVKFEERDEKQVNTTPRQFPPIRSSPGEPLVQRREFRPHGGQAPFRGGRTGRAGRGNFGGFDPRFGRGGPPLPRFFPGDRGPGYGGQWGVPLGPPPGPSSAMAAGRMAKVRCLDFEELGYCMRGDLCPMDHGMDRIVFDDVQSLKDLNLPIPHEGSALNPDAYDPEQPLWTAHRNRMMRDRTGVEDGAPAPIWSRLDPSSRANQPPPDGAWQDTAMDEFPDSGDVPPWSRGQKRGRGTAGDTAGDPVGPRTGPRAKRTLCVNRVPGDTPDLEVQLLKHFSRFGSVVDVRVTRDRTRAFVQFEKTEEAEAALGDADPVLGNRFVSLHWARHDSLLVDSSLSTWKRAGSNSGSNGGSRPQTLATAPPLGSVPGLNPTLKAGLGLEKKGSEGTAMAAVSAAASPIPATTTATTAATAPNATPPSAAATAAAELKQTEKEELLKEIQKKRALHEAKVAETKKLLQLLEAKTQLAKATAGGAPPQLEEASQKAAGLPAQDLAMGSASPAKLAVLQISSPKPGGALSPSSPRVAAPGSFQAASRYGRGTGPYYRGSGPWAPPAGRFKHKIDFRSTVLRVMPPVPKDLLMPGCMWELFNQYAEVVSVDEEVDGEVGQKQTLALVEKGAEPSSGTTGSNPNSVYRVRFSSREGAEYALAYCKETAAGEKLILQWGPPAVNGDLSRSQGPLGVSPLKPVGPGSAAGTSVAAGVKGSG